jgi:hypothetical protein
VRHWSHASGPHSQRSAPFSEQTEASQGAAKRKGEKRDPYQKAKKEAKKEVNAISKALKSSTKLEQNMKALELLLQYGNEEEKKKARTKLFKLSRIDDSSSSSDEVSNAESSDEDSDQE